MAEKRISVRLSAVGGDKVRAEFEGIGASGERGMGQVSKNTIIAQKNIASFANAAKIAGGVAVTAP